MFFLSVSIEILFLNPKALLQGFILTPCESRDSFIVYYNGVRTQIQRRINGALNNAKRSGGNTLWGDLTKKRHKNSGVKSILQTCQSQEFFI